MREEVRIAFETAIHTGRLSHDPTADNYIDLYMYMGTDDQGDLFKNINTRKYDV